jgi:hypothetical protein
MISLCLIAANCCFTAGVIAVREGRYDAAAVLLALFAVNLVAAILKERAFLKIDAIRHKFTVNLGEVVKRMVDSTDVKNGGESDEMQSCKQEADTIGD